MAKMVLVGVTGCVAAYKTCEIVRGLQKAGARVKVVMTAHATEFVRPLQFRALTREPVAVGLFDDAPADPIHHISLAQEADLFLIAPCTANVIAKLAHGLADDLLTTTALATTAPLLIAPAMNVNMYEHAATQANMALLADRGVRFVDAGEGYLACGDMGKGRLAEPEVIVQAVLEMLGSRDALGEAGGADEAGGARACDVQGEAGGVLGETSDARQRGDLAGKRILVTAGPTVEPIDPVRFISNYSSGKMGFALARAAARRGAQVTLVTGPVALSDPSSSVDLAFASIQTIHVQTAVEMLEEVDKCFAQVDAAIFSAAVSDMRPVDPSAQKLKKGSDDARLASITLEPNPDILATMGARKTPGQVVVGFAAETEDLEAHAREKLASKHADLIVANQVGAGLGFDVDNNQVLIVSTAGAEQLPLMSKAAVADAILDRLPWDKLQ